MTFYDSVSLKERLEINLFLNKENSVTGKESLEFHNGHDLLLKINLLSICCSFHFSHFSVWMTLKLEND